MKVISLYSLFPDQCSLKCAWDPDKLSETISDAVQAFDPKKIVDCNAKANHEEESKDLNYQEVYRTAGPLTTKVMGTYLTLPLRFRKLIVTTPAIVLDNHSYDILIGTGFMTRYGTITNHGDNTFKILGQTIPIY
ncbi:hypothetical protein DSO57_1016628 [Entomophthora muscae]|uniref:Uncharacterized protein n=1 Tax=Entomophthora muscae TaxID=34485 RepID=A0ACC2T539_9FUNG|nr:hypothetical protein DSO57_1016628 [Entomophthora muscae]